MGIGAFGGLISSWGFARCDIGVHDTCGVHNLHGIPGVLGGCFAAAFALGMNPNEGVDTVFPARGEDGTLRTPLD